MDAPCLPVSVGRWKMSWAVSCLIQVLLSTAGRWAVRGQAATSTLGRRQVGLGCSVRLERLGGLRLPRTIWRRYPHTGRTTPRPQVRALCAAVKARSPLLPAKTYSLRAASVFPTSLPPLDGL